CKISDPNKKISLSNQSNSSMTLENLSPPDSINKDQPLATHKTSVSGSFSNQTLSTIDLNFPIPDDIEMGNTTSTYQYQEGESIVIPAHLDNPANSSNIVNSTIPFPSVNLMSRPISPILSPTTDQQDTINRNPIIKNKFDRRALQIEREEKA